MIVSSQNRRTAHSVVRSAAIAAGLIGATGVAYAATTQIRGGAIKSITIVRGTDAVQTTSATFVDVPGASATIKVGAGTLVTARFSAESNCQGSSPSSYCSAQIVAVKDGVTTVLEPNSGSDFAFDSGDGAEWWESHSMDRSTVLGASGRYVIKVQYTSLSTSSTLRLDDWSLTIETADAK